MLAWKIAPALACGNTVVLKPAETTPLTALLFAEICQQADLPPGVVNIVTGAGDTGQALVAHPDVDKVAFTGSTEVGKAIARTVAGTDKKVTLELGGKAANIVFDDAPLDQAVEGIVNGIFFNQGHVCCAGSRLLVQESVADEVLARLKRRMSTLRVGDPLDKNTDIGAINSAEQLARIRELSDIGEAEGAGRWSPPCELPDARLLVPADALHRRHPGPPDRPRGDLRAGAVGADLPHARPRRSRRPTTRRTACPPASGPTRARGSCGWPTSSRRRGLGQHVQQVRPDQPVRRLQGVGLRPRGRPPRSGGLPEGWPAMSRIDVRKTYKLYIGGAFPRSESGHSYAVNDSKGRFVANAALASRKDARDAVVAARKAFPGWSGTTAYNRAQILYRVAEVMEDRRPQFVEAVRQSEGLTRRSRRQGASTTAIDRLVWYAGWADKLTQVVGNANPVAGPFFNLSTPEPTGVVAVLAPQESSLLGLVSVVAPGRRHRQHRGRRVVVRPPAAGRRPSPRCWRPPTCPAAWSTSSPASAATDRALAGLAHGRQRHRPDRHRRRRPTLATDLEVAAADNLKRVRRAPAAEPDWTRRPRPGRR